MPKLQDDILIKKLLKQVTVTHTPEPEDMPIKGNFAYGDPAEDRRMEEHVRALSERTEWGWCCVRTDVEFHGFRGVAYLGGCCYESREDFVKCDDGTQAYEACADLLRRLREAQNQGRAAASILKELRT